MNPDLPKIPPSPSQLTDLKETANHDLDSPVMVARGPAELVVVGPELLEVDHQRVGRQDLPGHQVQGEVEAEGVKEVKDVEVEVEVEEGLEHLYSSL